MRTIPPLDPREQLKRKRERIAILSLFVLFIALMILEFRISRVSSTLPFVNSIFFFGLVNLNIIILIVLLWLVIRNVGKLFIERRRKILGARLKTKLVISFLAFSIIPTLVLFVISLLYINTTFDKWFSIKIQNTLQASLEITRLYYRGSDQTANHFAEHIARGVGARTGRMRSNREAMGRYLEEQRDLLALDFVEYYSDPLEERILVSRPPREDGEGADISVPRIAVDLLDEAFGGQPTSILHHVGNGDLVRALVPVKNPSGEGILGVVVVSRYVPVTLVNKVDEISSVIDDYKDINPLKYPVKTAYMLILVLITLVMIFVAIWIGLFMAKELTEPVERLVRGAKAVGSGDLDVTIESKGHDEIAVLVDSFNKMTHDLRDNRERLTEASKGLERQKIQLEAILANVGTGVISLDPRGVVMTMNRAASQLLEVAPEQIVGRPFREAFQGDYEPLVDIFADATDGPQSDRLASKQSVRQVNLRIRENPKSVAAISTPLPAGAGSVVVLDDMTYLIKSQREMAWREVARRIAHEIKNPLTPIKLSAQRLQRRLGDLTGKEGQLLRECTDVIISHTDDLKEMVNEFSNFARMPEIQPEPHDLNEAMRDVVALFEQAHADVQFLFRPDQKLPIFEFDEDQIKRVLINLLDNSVAAKAKRIELSTHYHAELRIAVVDFKDNGPGMTEETKNRVFEPYFSTKEGGTGLGLAIAKRIVSDHHGFIRVNSSPGEGTQFVIELPTVSRAPGLA